jgi:hypothetical protein
MPELKKVEIETSETPAPAPPSDRVLELAERVGAMSQREQARDAELAQARSEAAETRDCLRSLSERVDGLSRQTENAERTAEAAATVAVATAEAAEEEEEEEEDDGVLSVTPEVETRVEITQTPLKGKSMLQRMIFGK